MQTYIYLTILKSDRRWMRMFIALLLFANTLKTGFDCAFMYDRFIHKFGDAVAVQSADWVFNTDPAMTAIIGAMVQAFFAWRVKILTGSISLTILILLTCLIQLLSGLATAVACGIVKEFVQFQKFQVVVILWLAFSAVTDIIIAVALVFTLKKNRTGFTSTDDIIDRLIRTTVQTGALTAVVALIDLIAFVTSTSGLHLAFNFPLAHLYTNSLLSSLNARVINKLESSAHQSSSHFNDTNRRGTRVDVELRSRNPPSKIVMTPTTDSSPYTDDTPTKVFMEVEEVTQVSPAYNSKSALSV